jgi:hypothetical protein
MPNIGDVVTVLAPFRESFPDEYLVVDVVTSEDGTTAHYLEGIEGAFDHVYLETVE